MGVDEMLKVNFKVKAKYSYNTRFQKGQIIEIDGIKNGNSETGVLLRVAKIWKKPIWFDYAWFESSKLGGQMADRRTKNEGK